MNTMQLKIIEEENSQKEVKLENLSNMNGTPMDYLSVSQYSKMTKQKSKEVIEQDRIENEIDHRYSVFVEVLDKKKRMIIEKILKNYSVVNQIGFLGTSEKDIKLKLAKKMSRRGSTRSIYSAVSKKPEMTEEDLYSQRHPDDVRREERERKAIGSTKCMVCMHELVRKVVTDRGA